MNKDADMWLTLIEGLVSKNPSDAIVASEKRGQQQLVHSTAFPKKSNYPRNAFDVLISLGMNVIEEIDDLFVSVELPAGWTKEPTDHDMWSTLFDNKHRARGSIFYKAAFYDRDAFVNLNTRYSCGTAPVGGWKHYDFELSSWVGVVTDQNDTVLWTSVDLYPLSQAKDRSKWFEKKDQLSKEARVWLDENYPNWEDVTAYWDE